MRRRKSDEIPRTHKLSKLEVELVNALQAALRAYDSIVSRMTVRQRKRFLQSLPPEARSERPQPK